MGSNRAPYDCDHDGRPAVDSGWGGDDLLLLALIREHPEKAPLSGGRPDYVAALYNDVPTSGVK